MRYQKLQDPPPASTSTATNTTTNPPNRRLKLGALLHYEDVVETNPDIPTTSSSLTSTPRDSHSSGTPANSDLFASSPFPASPYGGLLSPWSNNNGKNNPTLSPYLKSPWIIPSPAILPNNSLIGSIVRQEGHVYSLAASGELLYTGSDSKNIRVWRNLKEFAGFKSNSGLVKAIVIHGDKVFTGHQDGKIRIWKVGTRNSSSYGRIGSLPTLKDSITSSVNPKNYVQIRRRKNVLRIKHYDAVSCMASNPDLGLLYSGSWDKTLKVWRIGETSSNSSGNPSYKCLESIDAHDDAINAVATGFDSLVFTGSADGTVKVWKRELESKGNVKHFLVQTLLEQESAVTAVAVSRINGGGSEVVYCGSSDGMVNFWEREKHLSHGGALRGHKMAVLCLATAGEGLLFSGSADKSICVWRRESGGDHVCLTVLTGHGGPVKCLAVGRSDGEDDVAEEEDRRWVVYSGSLDRSVKIWRVEEHAPEWREYYQSPRLLSPYRSPKV